MTKLIIQKISKHDEREWDFAEYIRDNYFNDGIWSFLRTLANLYPQGLSANIKVTFGDSIYSFSHTIFLSQHTHKGKVVEDTMRVLVLANSADKAEGGNGITYFAHCYYRIENPHTLKKEIFQDCSTSPKAIKITKNKNAKDTSKSVQQEFNFTKLYHESRKVKQLYAWPRNRSEILGFVMPKLSGLTIHDYLSTVVERISTTDSLLDYCLKIVTELEKIHHLGFAHLDISSNNIMLDPVICIVNFIDFGAAKWLPNRYEQNDASLSNIGTIIYLAPEVLNTVHCSFSPNNQSFLFCLKEHKVDLIAVDTYALGWLLLQLIAGIDIRSTGILMDFIRENEKYLVSQAPFIKNFKQLTNAQDVQEAPEYLHALDWGACKITIQNAEIFNNFIDYIKKELLYSNFTLLQQKLFDYIVAHMLALDPRKRKPLAEVKNFLNELKKELASYNANQTVSASQSALIEETLSFSSSQNSANTQPQNASLSAETSKQAPKEVLKTTATTFKSYLFTPKTNTQSQKSMGKNENEYGIQNKLTI